MEMTADFSSAAASALITDTLRLFVGHGRRMGWADLAAVTGDGERKLRSYVEPGGPMMPFDVFARVFAVLPPEAFARVARHMGFSAGPLGEDGDAHLRRVMTGAARLVADGSEALEDGRVDHREMAVLRERAEMLLPALTALVQTGRDSGRGCLQ